MFTNIKSKNQKKESSVAKRGFISLYGLLLLSYTLSFITMLTLKLEAQRPMVSKAEFVEVYAIASAKQMLKQEETERNHTYKGCLVQINCDELQCKIVIEGENYQLSSTLSYDYESKRIVNYQYDRGVK